MYSIEAINEQYYFKIIKINAKIFTCAAAFAKLSKALVIAAVLWLFVESFLILQSIWIFVVALKDDDDDDDGGDK